MNAVVRTSLRREVRKVVLESIRNGSLVPGSDVNEVGLASRLGVSRTPLREALLGLESEGFLLSRVGRGFTVTPLTERDVEEIYPILWTLESLALRGAVPIPARRLRELADLNAKLSRSAVNPEDALRLDRRWHELLTGGCPNELLRAAIASLKDRAERYELAYMRFSGEVPTSTKQHRAILSALGRRDLDAAVSFLEENWKMSQKFLVPWIRGQAGLAAGSMRPTGAKRLKTRGLP